MSPWWRARCALNRTAQRLDRARRGAGESLVPLRQPHTGSAVPPAVHICGGNSGAIRFQHILQEAKAPNRGEEVQMCTRCS